MDELKPMTPEQKELFDKFSEEIQKAVGRRNKPHWYKLTADGMGYEPCDDLDEYGRAMEDDHKTKRHVVARTDGETGVLVSTVFLYIDHSWSDGPPVLYETMVFGLPEGHPDNDYQERYTTRQVALVGHWQTVEKFNYELFPSRHARWWEVWKLAWWKELIP